MPASESSGGGKETVKACHLGVSEEPREGHATTSYSTG